MTIDQALDAYEALPAPLQKAVGALQEKWLAEDEANAPDDLWFVRAVETVAR